MTEAHNMELAKPEFKSCVVQSESVHLQRASVPLSGMLIWQVD